jgi:hypothetical protein
MPLPFGPFNSLRQRRFLAHLMYKTAKTQELARKTSLVHDTSRVLHQNAIEALGHLFLRRRM